MTFFSSASCFTWQANYMSQLKDVLTESIAWKWESRRLFPKIRKSVMQKLHTHHAVFTVTIWTYKFISSLPIGWRDIPAAIAALEFSFSLTDHSQEPLHEKWNSYSAVKGQRKNARSRRPSGDTSLLVVKWLLVLICVTLGWVPFSIKFFKVFKLVRLSILHISLRDPL